ncbi:MAG TPA: PilN domain-containing protein [Thauera sp.]|jgi:type IV pilus assembly protein PilN|uniref:PilN domain-containing protein n=1 Tax=Thauera sp. TaxID=1905334 RepID=UPI000FA00D48|nr:PilN domain-containing protein [Thauera sp.]RTL16567.1 MAG: fimbrial protein [Rhodocyclaceae bacterium]MCB1945115.1 PilN domain-containing protein [Thauera sp.]MCP5226576.1 PilN domain-containing protein [Thauera sp.]HPE05601.1 PilN domain-containing protein [Thauera sp.]HRV76531.1 PilN domain-containing protein [Thauera sp.]
MIRINLLPHRIAKRRQRRQQFYALAAGMVLLGALIGFGVHMIYAGHIERQEARNAFLKQEIARVDRDIAEIRRLREQIDAMLARKQVIESLQGTRAETVHLFNELAQRLPDGVYLKSTKQTGRQVRVVGLAQSNARVSHFMRNVEASAFLEQPRLIEAKAVTQDNRRLSEFTLDIAIRPPVEAEPEAAASAPKAVAKGAQK